MKLSPFIAPLTVLFLISFNQSFAESARDTLAIVEKDSTIKEDRINQLAETCHQNWRMMDWTIGQQNRLAKDNASFNNGIQNICRARAELFFEGYEVNPFIEPDSQNQVFPIVFRYSVEEIKQQIRLLLPKLRLI
ncbi:hypothetical protein [Methylophaga sp.]|uniref:hypothetical protein n=1 Tax=Methylophaga sp. TaxID=2024840 RepID=UPI003F69AFA8